MIIKYEDLKNNTDSIMIRSINVLSIYDAFRKIFSIILDPSNPNFHQLTWNFFTRNDQFSPIIYDFIFYLFIYLKDKKYLGSNIEHQNSFSDIKAIFRQNLDYQDLKSKVFKKAKNIFKLANLDGDLNDILVLVEEFDIFKNIEQKQKIQILNFDIEPFDGCDIPS
ncbi:hypothetical protein [Mycoplasmopsis cynos]|uniref:hypothetical protein n=1 Tax=Mycoplasmopsis cynos TaxID=171284 RepID=UPI002AFDE2E5|nr:hypothetical protein [Mycoplasmopsis cynos]WQQ14519.1 hypothetical protein RRG42_02835 [Mycoplasmopsis cynos]